MLNINFIRENPEKIKKGVADKGGDPAIVDRVLKVDATRRQLIAEIEKWRGERNKLGKADIEQGKKIKEVLRRLEPDLKAVAEELKNLLYEIPNPAAEDVPVGKDESENVVLRKWGKPKKFAFKPKDHVELGEALGVIDIKTAAKVSGTRLGYLMGGAAFLEFALVQHVFNILADEKILKTIADKVKKGYSSKPFIPVVPPVFIKPEVYVRMARLSPETEIERYFLPRDNQYLIGSAEHTLGSIHLDEVLNEKDLPIRYLGFSTCFRREAGAYGKDTRGILRVHQFDKIEMESFTTPQNGDLEQEFIVAIQEYLMQGLEIPYQVVKICTGDMGGPDYRQMDINAWLPGQDCYRETHTSDYMTDYQSRRLNTRVRVKSGGTQFVYMNDATAFAIGRTVIAILENYQQKDGSVLVPKALQKYCGFAKISPRK